MIDIAQENKQIKATIKYFLERAILLIDQDDEGVIVRCIGCGNDSKCWDVKHSEYCPLIELEKIVND